MVTQFDDKGKFFTNIITKKTIPSTIQLSTHRVHGNLHVRQDERLKDELDRTSGYTALTDVKVFSVDGRTLEMQSDFMLINNQNIIWVIPDEDLITTESDHE